MLRPVQVLLALRSSLWFVPSLIVAGMVALAIALIEVDAHLGARVLDAWPRLFGAGADGSRSTLSTIATAMITVAGVVFSITIVVLSLTASQYTSRVLRNFMRDRSNQVVLGTFVGIYGYCLVVMRTIRGGDEGAFVPSIATLGAVALAFVGIAVLIHFIHHVSSAIQAARILEAIREETHERIVVLFPERLGAGEDDGDAVTLEQPPAARRRGRHAVASDTTGYLQHVDGDALMRLACANDIVVRVPHCMGDFVVAGEPLVEVLAGHVPRDDVAAQVRASVTLGSQRTIEQDVAFGILQIVDIAVRALSPGINDPTTATMCIDHLRPLLAALAARRFPSRLRLSDGALRVVIERPTFGGLLDLAVDAIRFAARDQPLVLRQLVALLAALAAGTTAPGRRVDVETQLSRVAASIDALADAPARTRLRDDVDRARRDIGASTRG